MSDEANGPIEVVLEDYLEDLIPTYLDNRRADVATIRGALASGDLETARSLGHQMKGSGGGYGFDRISEIGASIEGSAKDADTGALNAAVEDLADFLSRVTVRYE